MSNLPIKHGFLTPAEREYITQAIKKYPELAGSKKLRHEFKLKLSPWLIEELFQTLQDWSMLSVYFARFEKERDRRDMIRESIWHMDSSTHFLTRFLKDWIPGECMGELVSWLSMDLSGSSGEPPDPVAIIQAQVDFLQRLRFANPDVSVSKLEEKRLAALNAVNDLFLSIEDKQFVMNNEYDRASKVHTDTAYQVNREDVGPFHWIMGNNYTLRFKTEAISKVSGVGDDVEISWEIDFPKALLFLIDSGECENCFQVIERIRNQMVFEPRKGIEQRRKILILKNYDGFDATFINAVGRDLGDVRYGLPGLVSYDELASVFGNAEELWGSMFETFGPVYLDETVSKLGDIISKRGGKTSGILSVQSKMSDELGLLRRCGKDDLNRPTFTLTKKGKRLSRLLTTGKEKEQPIECILSFTNDDDIRQMIPIRGGDVGYLGINTFHPDDC